jgi:hypothetical protein
MADPNAYYGRNRLFIDQLLPEDDPQWLEAQGKVATLVRENAIDQVDEIRLLEMLGLDQAA